VVAVQWPEAKVLFDETASKCQTALASYAALPIAVGDERDTGAAALNVRRCCRHCPSVSVRLPA
jgi:hypothetical protein